MSKQQVLLLFQLFYFAFTDAQNVHSYYSSAGNVVFSSEGQFEKIAASSNELKGIVNVENRSFAFAIRIVSFEGFNGALQREHFNENYMESERYPNATFQGQLVDDFDFTKDGSKMVRSKGILKMHGIEQEKIIKVLLEKQGNTITVKSFFTVILSDYDIKIPRIVHGKISPEIQIEVKSVLTKR